MKIHITLPAMIHMIVISNYWREDIKTGLTYLFKDYPGSENLKIIIYWNDASVCKLIRKNILIISSDLLFYVLNWPEKYFSTIEKELKKDSLNPEREPLF